MIEIIQGIVEQMVIPDSSPATAPTFVHGEKSWQNFIADELLGDVIFLDEPLESNDTLFKSGYLEESYVLKMFFASKSELEWTPAQHQIVIKKQREQRRKFINRLELLVGDSVRRIVSIRTVDVKNIFDAGLSGCLVFITIVPLNDYSACP